MNAGASTSAVPSPIKGSGTAWVLLGSWALSPARPTPIHPRHECRGFSALLVTRPRQDERALPPLEQWLRDYDAHLEHVAGLALRTRQGYGHLVRRFLTAWCGMEPPDGCAPTAPPITTFGRQVYRTCPNTCASHPA